MNVAADGDRPSIHGQMLGKALALIEMIGRRDAPMPIPDTCLTCAFREGSMPNQTAGTGMMALNCVLRIDPDRFACHHGMKDGDPQRLCAGYIAAMLAPFSQVKEILAAFQDELATVGDQPDDVRAAFDAWLSKADPERRLDVYQAAREYAKSELSTPPPATREAPMTKLKEQYSGDESIKVWAAIANIEDPVAHDLLYSAGCALQDHEKRFLQMLRRATPRAEGK